MFEALRLGDLRYHGVGHLPELLLDIITVLLTSLLDESPGILVMINLRE